MSEYDESNRPARDAVIKSLVRNWTKGDAGTKKQIRKQFLAIANKADNGDPNAMADIAAIRDGERENSVTVLGGGREKSQISPKEYALLNVVVAQKLAGPGKTPTAKHVAEAQKQSREAVLKKGVGVKGGTGKVDFLMDRARNELSGISGMGAEECAGLWDKIKSIVSSVTPAVPFVGPSYGLAVPIAKTIATQQAKKAAMKTANAAVATATDNEQELDLQAGVAGVAGESFDHAYSSAEKDLDGSGMGGSEANAMSRTNGRRKRRHKMAAVMGLPLGIDPLTYRAAIHQRAQKISNGGSPTTKHIFVAQKAVDNELKMAGIKMKIPGAQPGRVTR